MVAATSAGPHRPDNEIQLLSVTAEGQEETLGPGASTLIFPGREKRLALV